MTKYNSTSVHHAALLIETNGRGEGAAFVALGGNLKRESVKTAIAIFDSLERAPWWEEVGAGYEFHAGEPYRYESRGADARELAWVGGNAPNASPERGTFFRDTRWRPPVKPLKVGDVIETVEDLERLPVGAGVVDYREEIALKRCEQRWNYANLSSESCGSESVMGLAPITVIYVPKAGESDE